jgi:RecA/RadA recombinase
MTSEHHVRLKPPGRVEDLFQRGKIVGLFGNPTTGKTTWALDASGHVLSQGGTVVYIDFDMYLSHLSDEHRGYAEKRLGVPLQGTDEFLLTMPDTLEMGRKVIDIALKEGTDLVVVDCVNMAMPKDHSPDLSDWNPRDTQGRRWREHTPEIREALQSAEKPPCVLLTISHRSWWLLKESPFWRDWQANTDVQFGLERK